MWILAAYPLGARLVNLIQVATMAADRWGAAEPADGFSRCCGRGAEDVRRENFLVPVLVLWPSRD